MQRAGDSCLTGESVAVWEGEQAAAEEAEASLEWPPRGLGEVAFAVEPTCRTKQVGSKVCDREKAQGDT